MWPFIDLVYHDFKDRTILETITTSLNAVHRHQVPGQPNVACLWKSKKPYSNPSLAWFFNGYCGAFCSETISTLPPKDNQPTLGSPGQRKHEARNGVEERNRCFLKSVDTEHTTVFKQILHFVTIKRSRASRCWPRSAPSIFRGRSIRLYFKSKRDDSCTRFLGFNMKSLKNVAHFVAT